MKDVSTYTSPEQLDAAIAETEAPTPVVFSQWPASLPCDAFHGLAGEITKAIDPHTEADKVAVLGQLLATVGNAVGHGPHFIAEADRHSLNLFMTFVGETAKGRKGTSWGRAKTCVAEADPSWSERIASGLSSGEGLIWQVRDPTERDESGEDDVQVEDPGVDDKRLLVYEGEFASVLKVLSRHGNTLSPVVRNAWDTGNLRTLTKNSPAVATDAHISIVGHITKDELLRNLNSTEAGNGFGNRILWFCVRRSKILPEGGELRPKELVPLIPRLEDAILFGKELGEIRRDEEARTVWHEVYPTLSEGKVGLLGALTARAEAQVMRIACIYAVLEKSEFIRRSHLLAGLAIWEYVEDSVRYIFGDSLGDPVADGILTAVRGSSNGLTRTALSALFGRNMKSTCLNDAINKLAAGRLVRCAMEKTAGAPAMRVMAVRQT
jgi:hypothetical protein